MCPIKIICAPPLYKFSASRCTLETKGQVASTYSIFKLAASFGTDLGKIITSTYSDGEFQPSFEESLRGKRIFIIGSTNPPSKNLMEMLLMIDAAKRASAANIIAVMPYFGYARQDRKSASRTPISAKLVANLITKAGADRILTMDLHAGQIQGFFDIPLDNIFSAPPILKDIKEKFTGNKDIVVASPDVGGVVRARAFAKRLNPFGCEILAFEESKCPFYQYLTGYFCQTSSLSYL